MKFYYQESSLAFEEQQETSNSLCTLSTIDSPTKLKQRTESKVRRLIKKAWKSIMEDDLEMLREINT